MQRALGRLAVGGAVEVLGRGHALGDGAHHARVRAPGDLRRDRAGVDRRPRVSNSAPSSVRSSRQCAIASSSSAPLRRAGPLGVGEPRERGLVGRDHAGAPAALDRHVADRHAALHRERLDRRAGVLDDVAGHAADAELAERAEDQVLGGDAEAELALVADPHRARLVLDHALRREHVLDLARADAEGERAEGAVRGGVRVAADDRHARLGDAELGADHVHDALAVGAERVDGDAELRAVALERLDLHARELVLDPRRDRRAVGRRVVVGGRERAVGAAHRAAGQAQAVERLRARDLVHEVQVDVEQARAATSWASQILSNSVCGIVIGLLVVLLSCAAGRRRRPPGRRASSAAGFSKWCGRSASKVTQSPSRELVALPVADEHDRAAARRARSRGCRARASAGRRRRRWRRPGASVWRESSARCPGWAAVSTSKRCPRRALPPRWRWPARTIVTAPPSSRRSSCERRSSRPAAIRAATVSVGLVSPRSTCESIGALTPLRSARSRSERPDRLAQRLHARADRRPGRAVGVALLERRAPRRCHTRVRYHRQAYRRATAPPARPPGSARRSLGQPDRLVGARARDGDRQRAHVGARGRLDDVGRDALPGAGDAVRPRARPRPRRARPGPR